MEIMFAISITRVYGLYEECSAMEREDFRVVIVVFGHDVTLPTVRRLHFAARPFHILDEQVTRFHNLMQGLALQGYIQTVENPDTDDEEDGIWQFVAPQRGPPGIWSVKSPVRCEEKKKTIKVFNRALIRSKKKEEQDTPSVPIEKPVGWI